MSEIQKRPSELKNTNKRQKKNLLQEIKEDNFRRFGGHLENEMMEDSFFPKFKGNYKSSMKTYSYSSSLDENGKRVTKKYYGEKNELGDEKGVKIGDMKEIYDDSEKDKRIEAEERILRESGRKRVVRYKDREDKKLMKEEIMYDKEGIENEFDDKWEGEAKKVKWDGGRKMIGEAKKD